jgi:ElaB/YqjD/DUF883 family membrane-anchored ribosome-binding protein
MTKKNTPTKAELDSVMSKLEQLAETTERKLGPIDDETKGLLAEARAKIDALPDDGKDQPW